MKELGGEKENNLENENSEDKDKEKKVNLTKESEKEKDNENDDNNDMKNEEEIEKNNGSVLYDQKESLSEKIRIKSIEIMFNILTLTPSNF